MRIFVEIGSLRERVEIIEAPVAPPNARIGRIRHANGENVDIDHATLKALLERAGMAGSDTRADLKITDASGDVVLVA